MGRWGANRDWWAWRELEIRLWDHVGGVKTGRELLLPVVILRVVVESVEIGYV